MANEEYKKAELPPGVEPCPVCGAGVELWHYSEDFENGPISKAVCCANGLPIGPQVGLVSNGCLLFMPPPEFYKATAREAVNYWNAYAKALSAQRRKRNWQRAQPLRAQSIAIPQPASGPVMWVNLVGHLQPTSSVKGTLVELDDLAHRLKQRQDADSLVAADFIEMIYTTSQPASGPVAWMKTWGSVGGGYSAIVKCHQAHIAEVEKQRDELVKALEEIATHSVCCDARHIADKALAKVKGGA